MQGWAFSRRWTGTERRASADSYYHEELHSAKHPCRTPRNGEVQATCQDVRVLERHQRRHGAYREDVLSMPDQPEQSAGRDTPPTWHPRRSVASASHRPLPPWWEWLRHCCWLLLKDALCSTSDLQLHQRHGHLSSEAAVWRARHTTQTAIWQWTAVRLRRVQDICSRLGIQARHKLTQILPVQRICRTHGPDCQENHAQGKAEQHWSRPLSAVPTHHPHRQQPPLPCRTPILLAAQIQPPSPLLPHTPRYSCPQEPASPPADAEEVPWPERPRPSTTPHWPTCPPAGSQQDLDTSHCCREEARTAFVHRSHSKWWSLPS